MEYYQRDNKPHILANAAWKGEQEVLWDSKQIPFKYFLKKDLNWATKFHVWKMDWIETYIELYLDNELLNEIDLSKNQESRWF